MENRPFTFRQNIRSLLSTLLLAVVSKREPALAPVQTGMAPLDALPREERVSAFRATGIWFQLAIVKRAAGGASGRELES